MSMTTTLALAAPGDDAELLALGKQWDAAEAMWNEASIAGAPLTPDDANYKFWMARQWISAAAKRECLDQISAIPATTLAGLRLRFAVLADLIEPLVYETEAKLVRSILADLDCMTGRAAAWTHFPAEVAAVRFPPVSQTFEMPSGDEWMERARNEFCTFALALPILNHDDAWLVERLQEEGAFEPMRKRYEAIEGLAILYRDGAAALETAKLRMMIGFARAVQDQGTESAAAA